MTADLAAPANPVQRQTRSPGSLIRALTARKAMRSGAIWGYIFGVTIASSALSYTSVYKTSASREALAAAYGNNKATSALFGPAPGLDTVAGFTVFKVEMTLMVLGAIWGLLTSTRLLRGEEDNGRWDILVAGQTTRRRALAQALAGLAAGVSVLFVLTTAITLATGAAESVHFDVRAAFFFAVAMVSTAVMFLAIGALTSQLAATRRQAAGYAAALLALSYAVRMVADAGVGLHGLIWASPLGWVEELRPFTGSRLTALLPIALVTAAASALAMRLATSRDIGAGIAADRATASPRLRLLSGHFGLGIRLVRPTVTGWWTAITVTALLYGLVAKSAGSTISGSSVQSVLSKLGAKGTGTNVILGVGFLIVAALVGYAAAAMVAAARAEERDGQLEHLMSGPVSRISWLGGRALTALVVLVISGLAGGIGGWLGAASQHSGVGFAALLDAGLNLVPPALTIYGVGLLAFGFRPRRASLVAHALLGWSLLVVVIGGSPKTATFHRWLLDTSVFHHMAASPAVAPHWTANAVMAGIGIVAALIGAAAFRRRDFQGE